LWTDYGASRRFLVAGQAEMRQVLSSVCFTGADALHADFGRCRARKNLPVAMSSSIAGYLCRQRFWPQGELGLDEIDAHRL